MTLRKIYISLLYSLFQSIWLLNFDAKAQSTQEVSVEGTQAPEFSLPDLNGELVSSVDYKGSYVVIHIATTWCPFCNAEAPHLEQLNQDYRDKNVKVLIIDVKEPKDLVKTKLKDRFNLTFPVLLDSDGSVAASFAPDDVLPDLARDEVMLASNILIDPDGKIKFFSLLDSKNFDAKLVDLKANLDELLASD
ncbi:MAG: peroxiredoxin family protein [Cyclobacteriaceae bacterium]